MFAALAASSDGRRQIVEAVVIELIKYNRRIWRFDGDMVGILSGIGCFDITALSMLVRIDESRICKRVQPFAYDNLH